jgi:pilus assembly protein CpaB
MDGKGADIAVSEIILSNIRVLAIDQAPKEKEGASALVGRTVTLELKPDQTEMLARSRQSGTLSLALRSIADIKTVDKPEEPAERRGENLNVIRYGVASQQTVQK